MNICFLVNHASRQTETYTTAHLALEAARRGHHVRYMNVDGFTYEEPGKVWAWTIPCSCEWPDETTATFVPRVVKAAAASYEQVLLNEFDVLFLRNNPADHQVGPDAVVGNPALDFGRILKRSGVLVLNDPDGIAKAGTKMYLTEFAAEVRPKTLISKQALDIKRFLEELPGPAILKPLSGYGGENVFYLERGSLANRNQIISAVTRGGFAIAQEYLKEAKKGDRRLLVLDGEPIFIDDKPAVYRRVRPHDDIRANLHVGGHGKKGDWSDEDAAVCAVLRDRLKADGLYFVGVDLIGSKLLELNVFAPGGIHNVNKFQGINVGEYIVLDLEKKVGERKAAGIHRAD